MKWSLMRLLLCLVSVLVPCIAQGACGVTAIPLTVLGGSPFVGFVPSSPDASQQIGIVVGMTAYNPLGAAGNVHGTVIDVTLTANFGAGHYLVGPFARAAFTCSAVTGAP
jgi:hypothetical protein